MICEMRHHSAELSHERLKMRARMDQLLAVIKFRLFVADLTNKKHPGLHKFHRSFVSPMTAEVKQSK